MAHTLIENKTYNERLFSPGLRGFFHNARFRWLYNSFKKLNIDQGTVIEVGCNDGRSLKYLSFKPSGYVGYDADWEGGFEDALRDWSAFPEYKFVKSETPSSFNSNNEVFDYGLAMETLEHLPTAMLDDYLKKLAIATKQYAFFTVPNERGFIFFIKYFFKKFFLSQREPFTNEEIWYALTGKMDRVERTETGHKGFDYKKLINDIRKYFDIVEVSGIPFSFLPVSLSFTIGIIVKPRVNLVKRIA